MLPLHNVSKFVFIYKHNLETGQVEMHIRLLRLKVDACLIKADEQVHTVPLSLDGKRNVIGKSKANIFIEYNPPKTLLG
jgi:hypothetical protein